jgi:hypothetical protein
VLDGVPRSFETTFAFQMSDASGGSFSSIHGAGVTRSASYWASYWRVKCTWWSRASRPTRRPHPGSQQASGSPLNAPSSGVRC